MNASQESSPPTQLQMIGTRGTESMYVRTLRRRYVCITYQKENSQIQELSSGESSAIWLAVMRAAFCETRLGKHFPTKRPAPLVR